METPFYWHALTRMLPAAQLFGVALTVLACPSSAWAQTLTLKEALSRAIAADFALPAAKARVHAAEAGIRQAGRTLNPSVGIEVENFGGSGPYKGTRSAETTFFLEQTVEVGGRQAARTDVARSELQAARARGAVRVLDLLKEVEIAWIEVMGAAEFVRVAEARLAVAQQLQTEIVRRSQAARDPLFAEARANAQVNLEKINLDRARSTARTARAALAAYWRGSPDFDVDLAVFEAPAAFADRATLSADVVLREAESQTAAARIALERARVIQNPSLRVGARHFSDSDDVAVVGGFSIPLPINDNNQANIEKAEAERKAAEYELASSRRALKRDIARLQARMAASATEARRIQTEVIPEAQRAAQLVREGFDRGAFSFTDLNEVQRTLNETRLRRIEVLKSYHLDNASLARLTGRHAALNPRKGKR